MLGKASSAQPTVGLSGCGALSHVYIQHPPLRCSIPGSRGLFYDDGNKLLLSVTSDQVFAWKTVPNPLFDAPTSDPIGEGPVLSIRYSLDAKVIGIQRSTLVIEFRNRGTEEAFVHRCKSESESILGFFWTDCPTCDVIFVKTSGVDMYAYEPELKALRLVETKRLNVSWYVYTHESRLVLLASGMQCKSFTGFQFSSGGVVRLPRFEMVMANAEANKKPVLAAEDVHIVTMYGRIYCLQVDRIAMLLHLYRFYRDAVVQQGSLPIYSSKIAVSVVDNVLLVHQVDAKVVILYDISADSRAPISAPLPLLLRGLPRANTSSSRSSSMDTVLVEVSEVSDHEGIIYRDEWTFLIPDLICDSSHGALWRIHLDLEAIAASNSEVPSVLEFLQLRSLEASKAKKLCLAITRSIILERRPIPLVARAIDVLVTSYSHSIKMGSTLLGRIVGGETSSTSGIRHVDSSRTGVDGSLTRIARLGKTMHESATASGVVGEPQQFRTGDVENESLDLATGVTVNRSSTALVSDSEENVGSEVMKSSSGEPLEKSQPNNLHFLGTKDGTGAETSGKEVEHSTLQPQMLGPSGLNSEVSEQLVSQVASPAISPGEMYGSIFAPVEEGMAVDPSYLVAIIVEYFHSAALENLKVHQNLNVLTIQLLARSERYAELGFFIINKILEPSKEVALQLLDSGRNNIQTRKLGMDMLRQLSLHHDYVLLLVQDGYYLEALCYARKNKVNTVRPSLFLEAAFASNDSQHLAAVLRFFSDVIPGFRNTSDYNTYCRILSEMNSSTAA
ncbi:regulator of MON1-CCZ1 complex-like isoform X2 [Telopea speciosissima]|nr:regulator of MON1-CCZ1 complex-like isoform X2 [Telopea speciosissima]